MKTRGFTIVEILTIMVILSLIILTAVPNVIKFIKKARDVAFEETARNIEQAAEYYLGKNTNIYVPDNDQISIPITDLKPYISEYKESEMGGESVIVMRFSNKLVYYYTGRENSSVTHASNRSLVSQLEKYSNQYSTTVTNGTTVKKFYGSKSTVLNNNVKYSNIIWQILEWNDDYIKLVKKTPISASFGDSSDWMNSSIRYQLNAVIDSYGNVVHKSGEFYYSLFRKDILVDGNSCIDKLSSYEETNYDIGGMSRKYINSFTKSSLCTNKTTDKIGILSFEDYVYSLDTANQSGTKGNSFLEINELEHLMTPFDNDKVLNIYTNGYVEHTLSPTKLASVRPVIYIKPTVKFQSGNGTESKPFVLSTENINR